MKTRLNKQLILETWSKFLQDVENASKNGTPGVPTFTDGIKKIKLDHNKVLQHAQDQKKL